MLLRAISHAALGRVIGPASVALARAPPVAGSSSSSSSLGSRQEFCHLIHKANKAHWCFSVAAHEARQLELNLDATKVAISTLEGEFAMLAVSIDQIRPPNKSQKEEKLAILITYAFTINQVPHVFGEHYFVGHKHKYME